MLPQWSVNFGEFQKHVFDGGRTVAPLDDGRIGALLDGTTLEPLDGRTVAPLDGDRTVAGIYVNRNGSLLDGGRTGDVYLYYLMLS
jgi:hypothetical protein